MGGECKLDEDCVTDHCYEGKCGSSTECRPAGDMCYTYGSHTCCSGECQAVVMKHDCVRLLAKQGTFKEGVGANLDRTCEKIGVCKTWPGNTAPGKLSTPWAVPATDVAAKYWDMKGLTFAPGVVVRRELFVSRRVGQTYGEVDASRTMPGSIRDAGVVIFDKNSTVATSMGARYLEGTIYFCVAPIVKDGLGGGYYAVGKNCCTAAGEFTCGDVVNPNVRSSLVIGAEADKYQQALAKLEATHGYKLHPEGKGIHSPHPMFVRIIANYKVERAMPEIGYAYVLEEKVTKCVAPIWDASAPKGDINFWAAGEDCCSQEEGFHCGSEAASAHSGEMYLDNDSNLKAATVMASVKYHTTAPARPMFLTWTDELLVASP